MASKGTEDAEHVMVCGPSGGGKSTHLGKMHATYDGLSVLLDMDEGDTPEDIQYYREQLIEAGGGQLIIDEAQETPTFRDGENGPTKQALHKDRDKGLKVVVATQNPMDFNHSEFGYGPLQQCEYWVFVGKAKSWHGGFLNGNQMTDLVSHVPTEDYEYIVVDPALGKTGDEKVVYRGQTDPQYTP